MSDFEKDTNLLSGKGEHDVKWITVNGSHIPIKDGQSPQEAIKNHFENKDKVTKKTFEDQVDDVLSGSYIGRGQIEVSSKTPKILQDIGFPDRPILISRTVIEKNASKHNLTAEQIKALPKNMEEPFLIMKSATESSSVVEYIQAVDKNNKPIMVAVKMDKPGYLNNKYIQANIVTSEYGRDNFEEHVKLGISKNEILYYNEKRLLNLPVNSRVKFPRIIEDLKPYDNIIRKFTKKSQ